MEPLSRQQVDGLIAGRVESDPDFRAELLADPRSALSALTGLSIPDAVTISVHEESPTSVHLVIPAAGIELSEEDLALVDGGVGGLGGCGASPCSQTSPW